MARRRVIEGGARSSRSLLAPAIGVGLAALLLADSGGRIVPLGEAGRSGDPRDARAEAIPEDHALARAWFPGFAVETASGIVARPSFVEPSADGSFHLASAALDLRIERVAEQEWELRLTALEGPLGAVRFPWRTRTSRLDLGGDSTVVLYPEMMGVAARPVAAVRLWRTGRRYPGECFAPLVVVADGRAAEIVAATNWPPREVVLELGRDGADLRYDGPIEAGESRTFRVLAAHRDGDAASGDAPWLRAARLYRDWLEPHLAASNLRPDHLPEWLQRIDGWWNVQLQNRRVFEASDLARGWDEAKALLPWMQLWGHMSDYAGRSPASLLGGAGAPTGCCIEQPLLHPRYASAGLLELVRRVATEGHAGFYGRPRLPFARLDDAPDSADERRFLLEWLMRNRDEYGANAFYVDVLGHRFFGEPLEVARWIRDALPAATVIEYPVDVYPGAFLISGSLGGGSFDGGPGSDLEPGTPARGPAPIERTTFPRFGRAILADRILFLGESNGDHRFWGAANDHWTERQAFLLGAKLDVIHLRETADGSDGVNRAVERIVALRRATDWWARQPVYLDRAGIMQIPPGVDARRFRGAHGEDLLVVDNEEHRRGLHLRLEGRELPISPEALSIQVLGPGA